MAKKRAGLGTDAFYKKTAEQQAGTPADQYNSETTQHQAGKKEGKVKATFYFDPDCIDSLESSWTRLRSLVAKTNSPNKRRLVTKSLIVELALKAALDELEQEGTASRLAKEMSRL